MEFRIADIFTDSLARLTGEEQKLAETTTFDLQLDPASPGMQFHRLSKSKDPNFWSVRVGRDLRLIVHKTASSLMLCYVDHHDAAYAWAERRKIERHPQTGAALLVEVRETVRLGTREGTSNNRAPRCGRVTPGIHSEWPRRRPPDPVRLTASAGGCVHA